MIGYVYSITNSKTSDIYVGSTIQKPAHRFKAHRSNAKSGKNGKLYDHIRDIGVEHFNINVLEECSIENESELCQKERDYYTKLKPSLNMIAPRISEIHETGRIYKLFFKNDISIFYIGSTKKTISKRLGDHRSASNEGTTPFYTFMRENGKDNFDIECVEDNIPIDQLIVRENHWISELKPTLNKNLFLCRTEQERDKAKYVKNCEKIKERVNERRLLKRDEINAQKRDHYKQNKEKISEKSKQKLLELRTKEITLYKENPNFTKELLSINTNIQLKEIMRKFGFDNSPRVKEKLIERILKEQQSLFN